MWAFDPDKLTTVRNENGQIVWERSRFAPRQRARVVLELGAGEGARHGLRVGERLSFGALTLREDEGR